MQTTTPDLKIVPTNPTAKPTDPEKGWNADGRITLTEVGPLDEWDDGFLDDVYDDWGDRGPSVLDTAVMFAVAVTTFCAVCVVIGFGFRLTRWAAGF